MVMLAFGKWFPVHRQDELDLTASISFVFGDALAALTRLPVDAGW